MEFIIPVEYAQYFAGSDDNLKNFNLAMFLGCCIISLGIVIAGSIIANRIGHLHFPMFPGSLSVTTFDGSGTDSGSDEFMSLWETRAFLRLSETQLDTLIQSGELTGTYTILQGQKIFSRELLTDWLRSRMEGN